MLQPRLATCFDGAGLPAIAASSADRRSAPVTGWPFPGRLYDIGTPAGLDAFRTVGREGGES